MKALTDREILLLVSNRQWEQLVEEMDKRFADFLTLNTSETRHQGEALTTTFVRRDLFAPSLEEWTPIVLHESNGWQVVRYNEEKDDIYLVHPGKGIIQLILHSFLWDE